MELPLIGELSSTACLLSTIILLLSCVYYYYLRSFFGAWDGLGVPGPKYEFFFGYSRQSKGKTWLKRLDDYFQRYGKNVASYNLERRCPRLSTCDSGLMKHIMVKDFNNFVDRGANLMTTSNIKRGLFFLDGPDWRRIRSTLSSVFSSGKLKVMTSHINRTGENLGKHLLAKATQKKLIDVKHECGHYTSELIATLSFGVNPKAVGQDDDAEFTVHTKGLINPNPGSKLILWLLDTLSYFFPFLFPLMFRLGVLPDFVTPSADRYFSSTLESAIDAKRGQTAKKHTDMLDLMMQVEVQEAQGTDAVSTATPTGRRLTHEEIIGQSKLLLFAGYETTASTFTMCLYKLAQNPEIQEKVIEEIVTEVKGDVPTYEELSQLKYTEQAINETLRFFPPLKFVERVSKEQKTYDGITIPANTHIMIHIWKVHMNPDYWADPEKFDPDRFSEENKATRDSLTFVPFGFGPRLCIGQRLAYLELKAGLVHVLKKVRVELNETTEPKAGEEMKMLDETFVTPEKGIKLAVIPRE
ncbi:cytochrome P450 3A29 [Aplysia californica]|uniref:Cytochrome P450 3A29 n=1 Tax=Aplysia californica TaxID=6500 RepID=A0ABM0ZV36_APLCA|nr:cytochrome P450 3A29 [Aplysia californica]